MNKQEIEKALRFFKGQMEGGRCSVKNCETCDAQEIAIDVLEQQLTNRWIPVTERLPEYTGDYNVTVGVGSELGYFEEVRTYRYEIYNGKNPHKKWIIPNNFHEIVNVIAWQPLPEPYKEDKDAERNFI